MQLDKKQGQVIRSTIKGLKKLWCIDKFAPALSEILQIENTSSVTFTTHSVRMQIILHSGLGEKLDALIP